MSFFNISFVECKQNIDNLWKNIELLDKYHTSFNTLTYMSILIIIMV
jgi:hypothetical protein